MKIGRILTGLALGMFLAALDQTVIATSGPVIASALNASSSQIWLVTPYLFASLVTTPIYGRLSDTHGRRPLYLLSIALFLLGSLMVAIAPNLWTLSLSRGLQGLGAGGLLSLAFVVVADLVPVEERGRYLFLFVAVFGASSLLGPLIGGVLAAQEEIFGIAGWRWIFLLNIPIAAIALYIANQRLHVDNPRTQRSIDLKGALVFSGFIGCVVTGIDFGYWGLIFPATALLTYGIKVEQEREADALIPLSILTNPNYNSLLLISFLGGAGFLGAIISVPIVLQNQQDVSPALSGLFLLSSGFGNLIATDFAGRSARKSMEGHERLLIAGLTLLVLAYLGFAWWTLNANKPLLVIALISVGAAFGLITQIGSIVAPQGLGALNSGTASSLNTFIRSLGGVIGTAAIASPIATGVNPAYVFLVSAIAVPLTIFSRFISKTV